MTLGLIARCDVRGGLANQTAEAFRHLHPHRTLVVHTDHSTRGPCDRSRYPGPDVRWLPADPTHIDARRFMDGLDVVFSCECLYLASWMTHAAEMGTDVVVQANPELYDHLELHNARIVLPTPWLAERIAHERILPVPVALDRFPYRQRTEARVFYHPTSPAMLDRNGTGIVLAALAHVTADITMIVRGELSHGELARKRDRRIPDNVTLVELGWDDGPYWSAYPDADVLVLPRRYGGLCLPAQEAAALGMPLLTTDLEPQRSYPHAITIPAERLHDENMKAGPITIHRADPRALAKEIDILAASPRRVGLLSAEARGWAETLAWSRLESEYRDTLEV